MSRCPKLIFFVTEDWYFCSHRLPLALFAQKSGFEVVVITRVNQYAQLIESHGLKLIPLKISRRGINPLKEFRVILQLMAIYKSEQPDLIHNIALKPVLYGSIAALLVKVPYIVNAMAGLGFLFSSRSYKARVMRSVVTTIFRVIFNRKNSSVILQNSDDYTLLCNKYGVKKERAFLIRGSGVDPKKYLYVEEPKGKIQIVLASRLLWDKGVGQFVEAAKQLKHQNISARFILVGKGDNENPSAISDKQLQQWHNNGVIEWWGQRDDMPKVLAQSHIVCLPSFYGEGVPKILIEAASCGRPIVTTNSPGCRDIVRDGINGFLVPIRDINTLVDKLKILINSAELRGEMGDRGRELVENEFSLEKVNTETLHVYENLLK